MMKYKMVVMIAILAVLACTATMMGYEKSKTKTKGRSTVAVVSTTETASVLVLGEAEKVTLATVQHSTKSEKISVSQGTEKEKETTKKQSSTATSATTAAASTVQTPVTEPVLKTVASNDVEPISEASTEGREQEESSASYETAADEVVTEEETTTEEEVVTEVQTTNSLTEKVTFETGYLHEVEMRIEELVNEERVANGLNALVHNSELYPYSQNRCKDIMVYFSHDGNDNTKYGENLQKCSGYNFQTYEDVAQFVYQAWYNSESHHENYLADYYVSSSVAVYYEDGAWYSVHNFALE
jgi:uncharacterized protein YkwD